MAKAKKKEVVEEKKKPEPLPEKPIEGKMVEEDQISDNPNKPDQPINPGPRIMLDPQQLAETATLTNMLTRTTNQLNAVLQQMDRLKKENEGLKMRLTKKQ